MHYLRRYLSALRRSSILGAMVGAAAWGQGVQAPAGPPQTNPPAMNSDETRSSSARAAPTDYQVHAQAGEINIGAEFTRHSIPTSQAVLTTEDYVAVEVGLFGPAGAHVKLSNQDFSLRINGKKAPLTAQPYSSVFESLKDPEWVPPDAPAAKSKTGGISTGGGGGQGDNLPPLPPKMPIELKRAMQMRVQRSALREGDRILPEGGLLFFPYHGKPDSIHSVELIYSGPAGKASLALQP